MRESNCTRASSNLAAIKMNGSRSLKTNLIEYDIHSLILVAEN
jgi:hypothetical protein